MLADKTILLNIVNPIGVIIRSTETTAKDDLKAKDHNGVEKTYVNN